MAEGASNIIDVVLGRKTAGDVARDQVSGFIAEQDKVKISIGLVVAIIAAGALLWVGASLAKGGWSYMRK